MPMIAGHLDSLVLLSFGPSRSHVLAVGLVHTFVPAGEGVWCILHLTDDVGHFEKGGGMGCLAEMQMCRCMRVYSSTPEPRIDV